MKYLIITSLGILPLVFYGYFTISRQETRNHAELTSQLNKTNADWQNATKDIGTQLANIASAYKIMYDHATPEVKAKVNKIVPQSAQIGNPVN